MTPETKKTWIWTGVTLVAVIVIVAILWAMGIGQKPPETM